MNVKDLILYKILFEEKNITHTAKRLFLSQPAISDRIKKLESDFNCQLIVREPRGIQFTPKGEYLYKYCVNALARHADLTEYMTNPNNELHGHLKIAVSNIFARYYMPSLIAEFNKIHPNIEINMYSGFSHTLYRKFREGKFPIIIARGEHAWTEGRLSVWKEPLCFFNKEPIPFESIADHPYILYKTDPILRNLLEEWWYTRFKQAPKTVVQVDNIDTCMKLVGEGVGYTLLSHTVLMDYPNLYAEPLYQTDGSSLVRETCMFYHNNYESLDYVKAFVDFMHAKAPIHGMQ